MPQEQALLARSSHRTRCTDSGTAGVVSPAALVQQDWQLKKEESKREAPGNFKTAEAHRGGASTVGVAETGSAAMFFIGGWVTAVVGGRGLSLQLGGVAKGDAPFKSRRDTEGEAHTERGHMAVWRLKIHCARWWTPEVGWSNGTGECRR
jgi:hypothetical protein